MNRTRILLMSLLAVVALVVPGMTIAVSAASASSVGHHVKHAPQIHRALAINNDYLWFINSDGSEKVTGQGDDVQARLLNAGTRFTQDNCSGDVYAFRNQTTPYKYLHFQTSNGHASVSRETTNGCSNNADKWEVSVIGNTCLIVPLNVNAVLGANSAGSGSPVFIGDPDWVAWSCSGELGALAKQKKGP